MKKSGGGTILTIPPALLAEVEALTMREKMTQGVRSLREGRVQDGEAFMARMDAELSELERQGHY